MIIWRDCEEGGVDSEEEDNEGPPCSPTDRESTGNEPTGGVPSDSGPAVAVGPLSASPGQWV